MNWEPRYCFRRATTTHYYYSSHSFQKSKNSGKNFFKPIKHPHTLRHFLCRKTTFLSTGIKSSERRFFFRPIGLARTNLSNLQWIRPCRKTFNNFHFLLSIIVFSLVFEMFFYVFSKINLTHLTTPEYHPPPSPSCNKITKSSYYLS